MLNVKLLRKVRLAILAEPELFQMESWTARRSCGTAACIAGHMVLEAGFRFAESDFTTVCFDQAKNQCNIEKEATALIGLEDSRTAGDLFARGNWTLRNYNSYNRARDCEDQAGMAKAAAAEITSFIRIHKEDK